MQRNPRGINAPAAIWSKPLKHKRHPPKMLIGYERAIAFRLEPVAKIDDRDVMVTGKSATECWRINPMT
ncbi:MAG: hypothetical protein ACRD3E_08435 [Terriglobales bacterium]